MGFAAMMLVTWAGWAHAETGSVEPLPAADRLSETLFRDLDEPISLTSFKGKSFEGVEDFGRLVEPVGLVPADSGSSPRFYVAPIVGASWGAITMFEDSSLERWLFGAGGAAGVAITRPMGQLRLEVEGRYRDDLSETRTTGPVFAALDTTDNWSAMVNVWRDVSLPRNFGVYGGGGIGVGSYRFGLFSTDGANVFASGDRDTAFAWQAGGGILYAVSDRITLDLGYRYYSVEPTEAPVFVTFPPFGPMFAGQLQNQFVASELLFTVRIYEPFRRWR
jgi:opacity protein-like surface antigen